jgi:hypothetical protein
MLSQQTYIVFWLHSKVHTHKLSGVKCPNGLLSFNSAVPGIRAAMQTCSSSQITRVGQNHVYTVYIRYFWQGNHHIYGVYVYVSGQPYR